MSENILLICTVGGTPEAVAAAIKGAKPQRVVFIVSPETHADVETRILPLLQQDGPALSAGQFDYLQVPDAQDFPGCVERIRELGGEVSRWTARGDNFTALVDFTGGTKCMSASMALVARQWPCRFSYVGGSQRNKDGKGVVVAGAEKILHYRNPWDALGYQVVEEATVLFDRGNYEAAAQILDRALPAIKRSDLKRELSTLKALSEAYLAWDRFDHKNARKRLGDVMKNGNDLRHLFPGSGDGVLQRVSEHHRLLLQFQDGMLGRHILLDLCGNARRSSDKGKYDDAVARLYRAIEATAQVRLRDEHSIPETAKVPTEKVPEPLRTRWASRAKEGNLLLGLQDGYELLAELGDELGQRFRALGLTERSSALSSRNQSILAHGFVPVGENVFKELWQKTLLLAEITEEELPVFPRLGSSVRERGENRPK